MKLERFYYLCGMPRIRIHDIPINNNSGVIALSNSSFCILGSLHREHHPQPFHSDYIENKTTCGGKPMSLSMLQFLYPLLKQVYSMFSRQNTTSYLRVMLQNIL